jgi:tellurite resistance protein
MDERVARCMAIAKVLAADGIVTGDEREFLESAMDALGLDPLQRHQVRELEGWEQAEPVLASLPAHEKRALVDGLVHSVLADGKVGPHEMDAIQRLSQALGLE